MSAPGPANAITDIAGVLVGHDERADAGWASGCTVVLAPEGAVCGVDSRGGAPGTRETDLLAGENLVQRVHGISLAGGSAYGLAAADGVMRWLGEREHGLAVGEHSHEVVPIVPSAVIFDLPRGRWGNRPDAEFGYRACAGASAGAVAQGCVGAGTGAKAGSLKGGLGTASVRVTPSSRRAGDPAFTLGALAVVNARGEAVDRATGRPWAAESELAGEFGVRGWPERAVEAEESAGTPLNTTVGVIATDAGLTKSECKRVAMSAQDGLARAVRPAHSMFDGDTIFAMATGASELPQAQAPLGSPTRAAVVDQLCAAAATSFSRAVIQGVLHARGMDGLRAYRDVWPEAF